MDSQTSKLLENKASEIKLEVDEKVNDEIKALEKRIEDQNETINKLLERIEELEK